MKKIVLLCLFLLSFAYAKGSDAATKDDIRVLSEQMDKRFEQMQHHMDKRFEDMQHYMNKRFEDMNDKFNMLLTVMLFGFGIVISVVGFYIKKIYHIESEIKAIAYDIQNSHNKKYFRALVETVERLAKEDEGFRDILKEYKLSESLEKVA